MMVHMFSDMDPLRAATGVKEIRGYGRGDQERGRYYLTDSQDQNDQGARNERLRGLVDEYGLICIQGLLDRAAPR